MILDNTHVALTALESLSSNVTVRGGSFSHWLPDAASLGAEARRQSYRSALADATRVCLRSLTTAVGLPPDTIVPKLASGQRLWPDGFVGSLTHKGAVVLGALSPERALSHLGVDLEHDAGKDLEAISETVCWEGLPPGLGVPLATLLAFSCKEASFKALYSTCKRKLGFTEVRLSWEQITSQLFVGKAYTDHLPTLEIRATLAGRWVVSIALLSAT